MFFWSGGAGPGCALSSLCHPSPCLHGTCSQDRSLYLYLHLHCIYICICICICNINNVPLCLHGLWSENESQKSASLFELSDQEGGWIFHHIKNWLKIWQPPDFLVRNRQILNQCIWQSKAHQINLTIDPQSLFSRLCPKHTNKFGKKSAKELQMAKEKPWIDVPIQILISHYTWKLPFNCEHKYDLWHHQWSKVFENICRFGFKCNCGSSGYQGLICSLPTKPRSCHQVTPSWHFHNTGLFIVDSKHTPPTFIPGLSPRIQGQKDNRSRRGWTSPPSKPALRFWQWWSSSVKGGGSS